MQCSHLGYILQLILKHIISSSAIRPAAIWTTSKNSTYNPPTLNPAPKKIRKTDSCQSSWVFYILPYCRTMWPLCIQASPAHLQGGGGGFAPEVAPAWCLLDPAMSHQRRCCALYLNSSPIYLPRSHYHCECYYYPSNSVVQPSQRRFGQQSSLRGRAPSASPW